VYLPIKRSNKNATSDKEEEWESEKEIYIEASRSPQFVSPTQWLILFLLASSLHSAMKIRSDVHKKSSAF
jgi:hypothetical protein